MKINLIYLKEMVDLFRSKLMDNVSFWFFKLIFWIFCYLKIEKKEMKNVLDWYYKVVEICIVWIKNNLVLFVGIILLRIYR